MTPFSLQPRLIGQGRAARVVEGQIHLSQHLVNKFSYRVVGWRIRHGKDFLSGDIADLQWNFEYAFCISHRQFSFSFWWLSVVE